MEFLNIILLILEGLKIVIINKIRRKKYILLLVKLFLC